MPDVRPRSAAPDLALDQWLAMRRDSLGASEAAAACGEDPNVSPLELVSRKRGAIPDEDLSGVEAVQWGRLLEPAIVAESARRAGLALLARPEVEALFADDAETELVGFVEGRQPFLRSRSRPWQTATPDGIARHGELGTFSAIEAKNQGQYRSGAWDEEEGRAPEKFQLQVAHQLAVAPRLASGILSGLVGGNNLRSVRYERAKVVRVIDALIAIEARIWECVLTGAPPGLSGPIESVERALGALHPDDSGKAVVLPEEMIGVARAFEEAKALEKEHGERARALKLQLAAAIGGATYGVLPDGSGRYSYKTQERAEHFVKASKFRVLRLSK
jgi:predicted phage-related endonuclease